MITRAVHSSTVNDLQAFQRVRSVFRGGRLAVSFLYCRCYYCRCPPLTGEGRFSGGVGGVSPEAYNSPYHNNECGTAGFRAFLFRGRAAMWQG